MVHDVRIDLKPDDYIDYMTYKLRPAAGGQRGQRGHARPAPGGQRGQRRGRGGRAERLGPQLQSVCKHFLFL